MARLRLLQRIEHLYPTIRQNLRFGSLELDFTRIADPNQVLDRTVAELDRQEKSTGRRLAEEPHLPYWAELWDSAAGVAQRLVQLPISCATRVLDLGCGMGLAGAVAAAMGARVLLADREPTALLLARLNTLAFARCARTRRLDWRRDRLRERFDLILGSDILYERSQWDALAAFWTEHVTAQGRVLLGEPGRAAGDLFEPWIAGRGWQVRQSWQETPGQKPIRIFELWRQ